MTSPVYQKGRRPCWLKLFALGLLILSLYGWLRLFEAIRRRSMLINAGVEPGPAYLAMTGLVIGLLSLIACTGLWLRVKWAPPFLRGFASLWLAWLWCDHLFVTISPDALANWPFLLGVTVLILAGIFYFLNRGRDQFK